MADTSNLTDFLKDIADAIREKKDYPSATKIQAENFDTEIAGIELGVNTNDATATADDLLYPNTAYMENQKITGSVIPEYALLSPTGITSVQRLTSYNLTDISYTNKIAVTKESDRSFKISNIVNNAIDYANGTVFSMDTYELNSSYSINTIKITPMKSTHNIISIFVCALYNTYNFMIARFIYNVVTKELTFVNQHSQKLGGEEGASYIFAPRPDHPEEISLIVAGNVSAKKYFYVRDYVINSNSITTRITNNTKTTDDYHNRWTIPSIFGYWDDNGEYFLVRADSGEDGKNCLIYRINEAGTVTTPYNSSTEVRLLNGGYRVNSSTVYDKNGNAVGSTNGINISTNTNINILGNYIFITNNGTTNIYILNDNLNLESGSNFSTASTTRYIENGYTFLYDEPSTRYLAGFNISNKSIIKLTRSGVDYYKTSDATAIASHILNNDKAYNSTGKIKGTMPNNGALSYTPTTSQQSIPEGYTSGGTIAAVTSAIDENIVAENIKKDVSILGVTGIYEGSGGASTILDVSDDSDISISGSTLIIDSTGGNE